tara:strand:- start:122 stop:448 length:327 start_codon:yes stop_codon:yes gene_type:complete
MSKEINIDFKSVSRNCLWTLEKISEGEDEIWTGRLEAFLQAMGELSSEHEFNGLDAITLIDVDRLVVVAKGYPKLEHYIQTLPQQEEVRHAQHLKVIGLILPVIANFA